MDAKIKSRGFVAVLRSVEGIPDRVLKASAVALKRGLEFARTISQREFLSGPRPDKLDIITSRLRQSISIETKQTASGSVVGRMGSNVKYAAYHEFGFSGPVYVRPHVRAGKSFTVDGEEVERRVIKDREGNAIRIESKRKSLARQKSGFVAIGFVREHQRQVDYKGRPFIRPALQKARPIILSVLKEELAKVGPNG